MCCWNGLSSSRTATKVIIRRVTHRSIHPVVTSIATFAWPLLLPYQPGHPS